MARFKSQSILTALFLLTFAGPAHAVKIPDSKRTEVLVSEKLRVKFRQPSELLKMVRLTPILNDADEVTCVEISEIRDPVIKDVLKARVGDCLTEVRIFREERNGMVTEVYPVLSATDAMLLYKDLHGASRVEIDLQRNKKTVPMTYVVN